ncbi:hypothetical protein FRY77_33120 [Halomonas sp. MG34]|nr:hypothetical protein [Halomonas sp. MG34]
MQIEIYINGEKQLFSTPVVPMLAKRKFLELEAANEEKAAKFEAEGEKYIPSAKEQLEEDAEMASILADVVFDKQFTIDQLFKGASDKYVYDKLGEAVFGKKKKEGNEGNEKGE